MDFLELASERYSVRNFKELPIPQMIIDKILLAGNVAPTAHNYQPQKIIVVNSQEGLRTLKKCTECHYNAPLAFIICYDREKCWKLLYDNKNSGDIDASIVVTHMMMEATELGIGTTWIMYFIPEDIKTFSWQNPPGISSFPFAVPYVCLTSRTCFFLLTINLPKNNNYHSYSIPHFLSI